MEAVSAMHPTDQALRSYGLGKLDDASAESVNKHLEGCPDCRRRVAELSSDSFLGRLQDARARPESLRPAVSSTDGLSMLDGAAVMPAPPPAGSLPPGLADLPNYEILRELGQGGMGVVYLAHNTLMARMEVLKVVSGHLVNRRGVLDRFLGEIRNAARLHHPNIVAAYTAIQLGESLVLAMEYVEGLDLSRLVKAKGPLPVANACNYVHQAALGLQHAHERGMVHRDIKPSNLMLSRQGNKAVVKVLDFGLAKVQSEGAVDGGLTHEGQMLGTPDYIAPEQISNARKADIRADIYSLGCTLYYLLTGKPPFRGASLYDILQAHHSMEASPLNLVRPEVPTEVAAIVAKMMAKEPERRFQEPKEIAQALKPFFERANAGYKSAKPDVSRAGQAEPGGRTGGTSSEPPPTATDARKTVASSKTPAGVPVANSQWESLIDLREKDPESVPSLVPRPAGRRPRASWPVALAASLFGLIVLGVIIITIRDRSGKEIGKLVLPEGSTATVEHSPEKVAGDTGGAGAAWDKPSSPTESSPGRDVRPRSVPRPDVALETVISGPDRAPGTLENRETPDPIQEGAEWVGENLHYYKDIDERIKQKPSRPIILQVTARKGNEFKALFFEHPNGLLYIDGEIDSDHQVSWKIEQVETGSRFPFGIAEQLVGRGSIKNERMQLTWSMKGTHDNGVIDLHLTEWLGKFQWSSTPTQNLAANTPSAITIPTGRTVWTSERVRHENYAPGKWRATSNDGKVFLWKEIRRNNTFIELYDITRSGFCRLEEGRRWLRWMERREKFWVSDAGRWAEPEKVPGTTDSDMPTSAASARDDVTARKKSRPEKTVRTKERETVPGTTGPTKKTTPEKVPGTIDPIPAIASAPNIAESELQKFQGVWSAKYVEEDGRILSGIPSENWTCKFEGEKFTLKRGEEFWNSGIVRVNPTKHPKQLDWIIMEGRKHGQTHLGIYSLEENTLKICRGSSRPENFITVAGSGHILGIYTRITSREPERVPGTIGTTQKAKPDLGTIREPRSPSQNPMVRPTQLFNGKNARGWRNGLENGSEWTIEGGILEGHGSGDRKCRPVLHTERGKYGDFRLRIQIQSVDNKTSFVVVRRPAQEGESDRFSGYAIAVGGSGGAPLGSIAKTFEFAAEAIPTFDAPAPTVWAELNEWHTFEISAVGDTITTTVDGKEAAKYTDPYGSYKTGSIALACRPDSSLRIKQIEIEETLEDGVGDTAKTATRPIDRQDRPAEADQLVAGTVWTGNKTCPKNHYNGVTATYFVQIRERVGARFSGHAFDHGPNRNRVEVEGEVRGKTIVWRERNSETQGVVTEHRATIGAGFIRDQFVFFNDPDPEAVGHASLLLRKPGGTR